MGLALPVVFLVVCAWTGCARNPGATKIATQPIPRIGAVDTNTTMVTIVGVPICYFKGFPRIQWGEIYADTNGVDELFWTDAVVLEIVSPKEYEGMMYGVHDDLGSAHRSFQLGRRYELRVPAEYIGKFGFGGCTADPYYRELNSK